jgi:hypothetical protein
VIVESSDCKTTQATIRIIQGEIKMTDKNKTEQTREATKPEKSPTSGESSHATPGQAEGDRATVEESLRQKGLDDEDTE